MRLAGLWENPWTLWKVVAIGPGSMGRPACETTNERVIPIDAQAGAELAEGPKEALRQAWQTIGWAPWGAILTGYMITSLETAGILVIVRFWVAL